MAVAGPREGRVTLEIALPRSVSEGPGWRGGGVAVDADGALIVAVDGWVSRVALDGRMLSSAAIPAPPAEPVDAAEDDPVDPPGDSVDTADDDPPRPPPRRALAPPVALADGNVVVLATPALFVFDSAGAIVGTEHVGTTVDDSALSPNVTHGGALVLTHMTGELEWVADGHRRKIGAFGYDVVPPAVLADDAMVVAGFAGAGLVCVEADGARRWRAGLADPDLLPAVDADGFTAAGSLNERRSVIVAPDGALAGSLDEPAVFAEGAGGDWFARGPNALSRVRRDGSRVWSTPCAQPDGLRWGAQAPVADADGRVYALTPAGLLALDARTGAEVFHARLGAPRAALAVVAPGLAAVVLEQRLVLIA